MRSLKKACRGVFVLAIGAAAGIGVFAHVSPANAKAPCPWSDLQCLDVWNPVYCSDGNVYSNACYARRACQFNCSGGGGGGV